MPQPTRVEAIRTKTVRKIAAGASPEPERKPQIAVGHLRRDRCDVAFY